MSAPSTATTQGLGSRDLQVCDRCLALSTLTVALAKVPQLRLEPPMTEPEDGSDPVPVVFKAPLLACADGLDPNPGALARAVNEVTPERANTLMAEYRNWDGQAVLAAAFEAGLAAFCQCSSDYPEALRHLSDAPPVLYVRGDRSLLASCPRRAISMVGTRHPTLIGREAARRIASGIARSGGLVISGMALGIDAAAHEGALSVGGVTVAVLASGADRPSPQAHRELYARILEQGAVVSEMPPGQRPYKWCFPARNRIIAALGQGTIVVEAPLRSGALITAEQAYDIGRDVYAVPGSLASDVSEGTNRLLQDGAGAVLDGLHLAGQLEFGPPAGFAGPRDGPLAEVHEALGRAPLTLAELARYTATSLGPGELELVLLDLEIAGWVARRPDGRYRVTSPWNP